MKDMSEKLKKTIGKYEIITFDIFDTLLKRNCKNAHDVWDVVEKKYQEQEQEYIRFREIRYQAEKDCYKYTITPTIDMIYDKISLDENKKKKLKELEMQTERQLITTNKWIYDVYLECKRKNKKIYAISDMYFSEEFLKSLLYVNGYDIEKIWVSCEKNKNKSSGLLFENFIEETGYSREKILHVGDNKKADYYGAKKAKIESYLIPATICNMTYFKEKNCKSEWEKKFLYPMVNNMCILDNNRRSQIGYETLGPMVVGFCQWVHKMKEEHNFELLLFCARDVKQTMEIYKDLYPNDKVRYLCVSLKSLETPYKAAIKEDNSTYAKEQLENIRLYLSELGCRGKVAMVDSGYGGHTQNMLKTVLGDMCECHGLYMRMSKNFHKNVDDTESYPYMFSNRPSAKSSISGAFFETMLSATHGRTLEYRKTATGAEPLFGEDNPETKIIDEFQSGIQRFYEDWMKYGDKNHMICARSIQDAFLNFSFFPEQKDVELLCHITGGNEFYREIVLGDKDKNFFQNLRDTYWKGGFLCKTFNRYKLICKCYLLLDCTIINLRGF